MGRGLQTCKGLLLPVRSGIVQLNLNTKVLLLVNKDGMTLFSPEELNKCIYALQFDVGFHNS